MGCPDAGSTTSRHARAVPQADAVDGYARCRSAPVPVNRFPLRPPRWAVARRGPHRRVPAGRTSQPPPARRPRLPPQRPDRLPRPTGRRWADGEPVGVLLDELPHAACAVEADVVPEQDDRTAGLAPGPDEQAAEVRPAEVLGLFLAASVLPQPVDQP
ncbi:hypothetical protein STPH1_7131 [Streptomyces sp. OM5714]|nr:hypothetical protein STPH1_7131 [Streptomyces sp. OM5714]